MTSASRHGALVSIVSTTVLLLALILLVGCGITTGTADTTNAAGQLSGAPTSMATATPSTPAASSTTTGCPLATQVVQWPSPPALIITSAQSTNTAVVHVGQSIELALAFGHRWSLGPNAGQPALALNEPAGYGDTSLGSCIWRFTAEHAGTASVSVLSAPICQAHMQCPQMIAIHTITVTVDNAP